ncbi:GAP family protein [Gordonia humi]|uniref:GAP family protein n=1 Tax=Gordonia humi TaxID=686429 RepID=UPI0036153B99
MVTWTKRPASDRPADDRTDGAEPKRGVLSRLDDFGVWTCLAIGFGEGVVIIKNLPLAISAGTRLGSAGLSSTHLVVTVVLFAALSSTTVVIPLVASIVGGDRVERPLYDARAWIEKHMTAITLVVLVVVGFIFLGEGLDLAD